MTLRFSSHSCSASTLQTLKKCSRTLKQMNKMICRKIFETFKKNNPSPNVELNYHSPFELLVAVLLSAQSTDVGVNKATPALFKIANTPEKMAALGETKLKTYIKTIGLYNNKAKNIIKTSKILVDQYKGKVPNNREALESLPGIGRKSANVILNSAFGHATIGVDTHVFRVSNRTRIISYRKKCIRRRTKTQCNHPRHI